MFFARRNPRLRISAPPVCVGYAEKLLNFAVQGVALWVSTSAWIIRELSDRPGLGVVPDFEKLMLLHVYE